MPAANRTDTPISRTTGVKDASIHLRMDEHTKRTLERAAACEETTVSRFVLSSAIAAAERIIESKGRTVLPTADWDAFHDALLDPPEPNAVLKAAARRYRKRVAD